MMDLNDLGCLLSSEGRILNGVQTTPDEACALAERKFPGKPYCLVADWVLIDITLSPSQLEDFKAKGFNPTFLFARQVILDSKGRFQYGDWVRSTFESYFEEPGWFLTKNTLYVLLGQGGRKIGPMSFFTDIH